MSYLKGFGTRRVPQWVPPAGQSANSAGGHAWTVDVWTRLRRFLILGSEGGSYHASEPALTRENASAVDDAVREDGLRAVEGFRGWGRSPRRAVAGWYVSQSPNALAYQAVKYGNLATMTRVGVIAPGSTGTAQAVAKLGGAERIRAARVHPIALLAALRTYSSSRGACGHGTWSPVREIVDALDGAFYASFRNVVPAGTRLLLALDVSGSMTYGEIAGVPGLSRATRRPRSHS